MSSTLALSLTVEILDVVEMANCRGGWLAFKGRTVSGEELYSCKVDEECKISIGLLVIGKKCHPNPVGWNFHVVNHARQFGEA